MVAKLGLTTGIFTDLADIAPESDKNDSRSKKIATMVLGGIATAAGIFLITGIGLRLKNANRLLTDEKFADKFMGGTQKHIRNAHMADYAKATFSPENFRDIWPNTKSHFRIMFTASKQLKEGGVNWKNSWKGLASLEKIVVMAVPTIAGAKFGQSIYNYFQKPETDNTVVITTPFGMNQQSREKVQDFVDDMNKEGIAVRQERRFDNGSKGRVPEVSKADSSTFRERVTREETQEPSFFPAH